MALGSLLIVPPDPPAQPRPAAMPLFPHRLPLLARLLHLDVPRSTRQCLDEPRVRRRSRTLRRLRRQILQLCRDPDRDLLDVTLHRTPLRLFPTLAAVVGLLLDLQP